MEDLNPCPFCGGDANLFFRDGKHGIFIYAACEICDASSKCFGTRCHPNKDEFWECGAAKKAVAFWNRRCPDAKQDH